MGQAKQRGTVEQRKVIGEARRELEVKQMQKELAEYEAALTPAQKSRRTQLGLIVAMASSLSF